MHFRLGGRREQRLRDPEVDDLDQGSIAGKLRDEHVARLDVPMHHSLVVCMVHRRTHAVEEPHARRDRCSSPIAEDVDRLAPDILHHEIGPPAGRRAPIDHLRDRGVAHACENLPLAFKPGDHRTGVHPGLDHLNGNLLDERLLALGEPNHAEPTVPELGDQRVRPNRHSRRLGAKRVPGTIADDRGVRVLLAPVGGVLLWHSVAGFARGEPATPRQGPGR